MNYFFQVTLNVICEIKKDKWIADLIQEGVHFLFFFFEKIKSDYHSNKFINTTTELYYYRF